MTKKKTNKTICKISKNNYDSTKTKICINLFIEKELPFFEDVLDKINKIKQNNYEIIFNIYNASSKYDNKYILEKLPLLVDNVFI